MTTPGGSSKIVWFLGFLLFGMATFDVIMHKRDVMTYTFLFIGLLAFAVAYCLQKIDKRITSLEQTLQGPKKG